MVTPLIPDSDFVDRLERTRQLLSALQLDALLCYASHVEVGSVRYLTGYEPWQTPEEWAFLVLVPGANPSLSLLSNSRWDFDYEGTEPLPSTVDDLMITNDWVNDLAARLPDAGRVGVVGYHSFPTGVYGPLAAMRPQLAFVDVGGAFTELRLVKSPAEISVLRAIGRMGDAACQAFSEAVHDGVTEREVSAAVDHTLMLAGAEGLGYPTNIGSGPRTAAVCFRPTTRRIAAGDLVQLDCAPMRGGYRGDVSRATVVADGDGPAQAIVEALAEMYDACSQALGPGTAASAVALAGSEVARRHGFGDRNFFRSIIRPGPYFMAHGIGLANPDPPGLLTNESDFELSPGMVINLEPLLVVQKIGAARIEGAFVITDSGSEALGEASVRPWVHR